MSTDQAGPNNSQPAMVAGEVPTSTTALQRNTMVTIEGSVGLITDEDEFVVTDATGVVPVWTGQTFFAVQPGETVVVTGFVDGDSPLEIYAQQITRADGSVVSIRGAGSG